MKKKMEKKQDSKGFLIGVFAICLVATLGFSSLAVANTSFLERAAYYFGVALAEKTEAPVIDMDESFGAAAGDISNFTAITLSEDLVVTGVTTLTGASTITGAVGINGTSTATTVLDMLGTMRTYSDGVATTTCDTGSSGAMMFSTGTAKLMGCDGTTWQALW